MEQGKLDKVEYIYQRALVEFKELLKPNSILSLSVIHSIGTLYRNHHNFDEAEDALNRGLAGRGQKTERCTKRLG